MASDEQQSKAARVLTPWLVVLGIVAIVAFFVVRAPTEPPHEEGSGGAGGRSGPTPVVGPRCQALGPATGFRVGGARKPPVADAGSDAVERFVPFAPEVGRGTAVKGGFAVGVKREQGGASLAAVALLDEGGYKGRLVELGRARGDMDAPAVVVSGEAWVAAMVEPNASGLALRLVQEQDGKLQWGAEIDQGRDESLAYDLAIGDRVGVVSWDDVTEDGKRAIVLAAVVSRDSLELKRAAQLVSPKDVDAEIPRVVVRPGGFWLAYVARSPIEEPAEGKGRDRPKATEGRFSAERIEPSWIELLPMDQTGQPAGAPQLVTPRNGHVLAFDLQLGEDGAALIAWRDDDTPSGAHGGRVNAILVGAAGGSQEQLVAEDNVGSGVPDLLGRWIALPDARGAMQLAPVNAQGVLQGELMAEPVLGVGEVIAAVGERLLVARPGGNGVDLVVVRCEAGAASVDGGADDGLADGGH
jgi:hypothetical protein